MRYLEEPAVPDPVALTGDQARDPEDDKDERRVYGVDPRESLLKYKVM